MAFKSRGDVINGYRLVDDPQLSGQSKWAFAIKGRRKFFIKQFLSPVKPSPGDAGSKATLERKMRASKIFEERHNKLKVLSEATGVSRHLVVPIFSGWVGGKYTKIFPVVEAIGTTAKDVSRLTVAQRSLLMLQVSEAIHSLHSKKIVHSDIKWTNLLFTEKFGSAAHAEQTVMPMVIDFDAGFHLEDRPADPDDLTFDAPYAAPEIWRFDKTASASDGAKIGLHTDIFALGVLFHEMANGQKPLGNDTEPFGRHMLTYAPKMKLTSRSTFYPLVSGMLKYEPDQRPTIEQVIKEISSILGVKVSPEPVLVLETIEKHEPEFIEARPPPPAKGLKGMLVRAWRWIKGDSHDASTVKTTVRRTDPPITARNEPVVKTTVTSTPASTKAMAAEPQKLKVSLPKRAPKLRKPVLKHNLAMVETDSPKIKTTIGR